MGRRRKKKRRGKGAPQAEEPAPALTGIALLLSETPAERSRVGVAVR